MTDKAIGEVVLKGKVIQRNTHQYLISIVFEVV